MGAVNEESSLEKMGLDIEMRINLFFLHLLDDSKAFVFLQVIFTGSLEALAFHVNELESE